MFKAPRIMFKAPRIILEAPHMLFTQALHAYVVYVDSAEAKTLSQY